MPHPASDTIVVRNKRIHAFSFVIAAVFGICFLGAAYAMLRLIVNEFHTMSFLVLSWVLYSFYDVTLELFWKALGEEVIKFQVDRIVFGQRVFGLFRKKGIVHPIDVDDVRLENFDPKVSPRLAAILQFVEPQSPYYLEIKLRNKKSAGLYKNIYSAEVGEQLVKEIKDRLQANYNQLT